MKVGSLFSGIGGFDLAFSRAGLEVAWQSEIDKHAAAVLSDRFPGVINHGDVKNVGTGRAAAVDVIVGGFPCQDLSVAGRREGLAGERSGLWFEFHRVLEELRPQWCLIENVPGLLSSNKGRDFAVILQGLGELGYLVSWRILDAQYFGVPQRRRRVFIVGSLGDSRSAEVLFEREGVPGDPPARRAAEQEVAGSLGGGSGNRGWCDDLDRAGAFVATPGTVRRLTPLECERLQGFPDGWTNNGQTDGHRYRQLGNAVAVPVVEWIARRMKAAL